MYVYMSFLFRITILCQKQFWLEFTCKMIDPLHIPPIQPQAFFLLVPRKWTGLFRKKGGREGGRQRQSKERKKKYTQEKAKETRIYSDTHLHAHIQKP